MCIHINYVYFSVLCKELSMFVPQEHELICASLKEAEQIWV